MPTALITGAGGGIGSAIATALAPTHTLLLAGRPSDRLDAVAERLGATTFPLDLTDADEIEATCEIVDELDVLVHNAGVSIPGHVAESDVDEWRAATEYNGYTSSDPNIVWWWRALKSFNRDERAKVLSFATGTSRVPLSGFVDLQGVQGVQRFSIHRAYGESDRLPQAHTCKLPGFVS